jgi:hypothetical protein
MAQFNPYMINPQTPRLGIFLFASKQPTSFPEIRLKRKFSLRNGSGARDSKAGR